MGVTSEAPDFYPIPNGEPCKRCGAVNFGWNLTASGAHFRADCPSCGAYVKFVGKKELDLPRRSIRSSEVKSSTRYQILARDGHRCMSCGRRAPDVILHVDHILPVEQGGDGDNENLITLCEECNIGKSNGHTLKDAFVLWMRRRGGK